MKTDARELDRAVQDWWLSGKHDSLLQRILEKALTGEPTSVVPVARALQVLETRTLGPAMQERVAELRGKLEALQTREAQIDALGDLDNEPQALFEVLQEDVASIQGFALDSLRGVRLPHSDSRGAAARAFLDALGWERLPPDVAKNLCQAVDDVIEREEQTTWGLFVDRNDSNGLALGLKLVLRDSGGELFSCADDEMCEQARVACRLGLAGKGWEAKIEWPALFAGESIGLPLYVAVLVARGVLPHHAFTATTGRLDIDGKVRGVVGIRAKLEAARRIGICRVLVPEENSSDAKNANVKDITVIPVAHVDGVKDAFRQAISSIELGYSGLIHLIRASLPDYQLVVHDEGSVNQGFRFVAANASGHANIWVYRNGRVRVDGTQGPAHDAAVRLIRERKPPDPEQRDPFSFQIPTSPLQEQFRKALQDAGATTEPAHNHELWRMRLARGRSRATIVLYNSSKCVIQGTAPAWDDVEKAAENVTQTIGGLPKPQETSCAPHENGPKSSSDDSEPHIGTDEAGKGDYFGPLVSAAVFVDRESSAKLRQLGVRDSKKLTDRRVKKIAGQIRQFKSVRYAVTAINPRKFNELYQQFRREGKNLNSLLAWGHARSIDNLLSLPPHERVNAKFVLVDQFADKHYIEQRTRRAGIPVRQRHKAEEDIAVAAASILARDGFLRWLEQYSERTQIPLPKGASQQVIQAAKEFIRRWGVKWLGVVAKLNFRTTQQVLDGEDTRVERHRPNWISDTEEVSSES